MEGDQIAGDDDDGIITDFSTYIAPPINHQYQIKNFEM